MSSRYFFCSLLSAFLKDHALKKFIVATESGILHQMKKQAPEKEYIPAPPDQNCACNDCPYMKLNTLEKLYLCMKNRSPEITLDPVLAREALGPIERMLAMS